jgi:lysozyme
MSVAKTVATAGSAGVIACAVAFIPGWEGMDKVAARDRIGTGHPITYCNGLTSHDGSVRIGQRFTKQECDERLAKALPPYLAEIEPCIHVALPDKTKASLLDAAFNSGSGAVCKSPMVAKMNAGNIRAGCNAFNGWYVRSDGEVRTGLIDRRAGELHGDKRKSERALCLEGLGTASGGGVVTHAVKIISTATPSPAAPAPYICTPRQAEAGECLPLIEPPKNSPAETKSEPPKPACPWWRKCA